MQAKAELVDSIRSRYYDARKRDKSRVLDEFVAITGHQRKYALRMFAESQISALASSGSLGRKIYDGAVKEVFATLWESSDRLCGNLSGSFIHSLVATDVSSGWTECIPILIREQSLVVETMGLLRNRFPFSIVGINTDNDSSFINESLIKYCSSHNLSFTRSMPYRKNDQAWIEQKNGSIVRKYLGYHRYSGPVACQTITHIFNCVRWYVNVFQPSFKLLSKAHRTITRKIRQQASTNTSTACGAVAVYHCQAVGNGLNFDLGVLSVQEQSCRCHRPDERSEAGL
jgi:hypothetical protein